MNAEISFDCIFPDDEDHANIEGCYRLPGQDWKVFYFGRRDWREPEIIVDAVFQSGVRGVNVWHPEGQHLSKLVAMQVLGHTLGVTEWAVVVGPDSLQLK
jgi:hypothetical protein